jgi:hypothetical protein
LALFHSLRWQVWQMGCPFFFQSPRKTSNYMGNNKNWDCHHCIQCIVSGH